VIDQERSSVRRLTGEAGAGGVFSVPSRSHPDAPHHLVLRELGIWCPCPGYAYRGRCRHAGEVETLVTEERRERARVANEEIGRLFDCG